MKLAWITNESMFEMLRKSKNFFNVCIIHLKISYLRSIKPDARFRDFGTRIIPVVLCPAIKVKNKTP